MVLGTGLFTVQFLKPLLHVHNYMQLFKKGSILLVQQTSRAKCSESSSMKLNVQTANVFSCFTESRTCCLHMVEQYAGVRATQQCPPMFHL